MIGFFLLFLLCSCELLGASLALEKQNNQLDSFEDFFKL
ncbi:hypothetical protein SAMN04488577_2572 [Bacillus sp. cl95]|nr:hypothetical protein SAMN02799634_102452 [Bacillus sp. UNCCL13]SFQ85135.1 hypothetical protein SAMN04488577_2572 [Bacillus sp. cl95]